MRCFRIMVVLLSLCCLTSSAFAAGRRPSAKPRLSSSAWAGTLAQSFLGFLKTLWSADGGAIDPLGRCTTQPTTDNGCAIDPLGRCAPRPTTENGCAIDPLGLCK